MALYHLHCDIIGRSSGRSATAVAAYRATCRIADRTTGEVFDYTRKEKALFSEILGSDESPDWARDRSELWNRVEEKESRKNSQFCRSFDIALMKELSLEQNIELVRMWVMKNYISRGLVADISVHAPHKYRDGTTNNNLHAHVLIPTRFFARDSSDGWGDKDREANDRGFLRNVRTSWSDIVNAKFAELGMSERIDERTLAEQGIERAPQQHMGAKATALERKGKTPNRGRYSEQKDTEITEKEIEEALRSDIDIQRLEAYRNKLKSAMKSPEYLAEKKFQLQQERIGNKGVSAINACIKRYNREELYHFVKQNAQKEIVYWQGLKSASGGVYYNESIDAKIHAVREISGHPTFDKAIYPKVNKYYADISSIHHDKNGHFKKFCDWVNTTDYPPVKVCRITIAKLTAWRDSISPAPKRQKSNDLDYGY